MKKLIILISSICFCNSYSQTNLVLNPSFESNSACPGNVGELDKANFWDSFGGSCDYFTPCGVDPGVKVPSNTFGYQYASNGNSYAGFIAYYDAVYYREVLGGKLSTPLSISQKYFFSFRVSRGTKLTGYGINKVGIKLTQTNSYTVNPSNFGVTINNTAHYSHSSVISDTLNWVQIKGSVIADSAYQYIMIGNFFDDANTTFTNLPPGGGNYAYYFVDDVCLSTDSAFVSEFAMGLDRLELNNESIQIYPNPASDQIFIECAGDSKFIVYDCFGKEVKTQKIRVAGKYKIQTGSWKEGIYYVHVNEKVQKLMITH
jgi:hypothetical protein